MRRADATRLYYGLELFLSMPTWDVMSVYLVSELDLSPLQLVLMGTAMEGAVFLCEIPTGVLADTYSRRLSLIVGFLGMGFAWILVGVFSAPWLIIAGILLQLTGLAVIGLIGFAIAFAFTLITLPVEIGASGKALAFVEGLGMVGERQDGARAVLKAAAWTYVAAALTAMLQFLYYFSLVMGRRD